MHRSVLKLTFDISRRRTTDIANHVDVHFMFRCLRDLHTTPQIASMHVTIHHSFEPLDATSLPLTGQ